MHKKSKKFYRSFFLIWISLCGCQTWSSSGGWSDWFYEKLSRGNAAQSSPQQQGPSSSIQFVDEGYEKPKPLSNEDLFFCDDLSDSVVDKNDDFGFVLMEDSEESLSQKTDVVKPSPPSGSVTFYCDPRTFSQIIGQNFNGPLSEDEGQSKCSNMIFSPKNSEIYQDYLEEVSALGSLGVRNFLRFYEVHPDVVAWLWERISLRQASHVIQMTYVYWYNEIEQRHLAIDHLTTPDLAKIHKVHPFLDPGTFCVRLSLAKQSHREEVWSKLCLEARLFYPLTQEHFQMSVSDFNQAYLLASLFQTTEPVYQWELPHQEEAEVLRPMSSSEEEDNPPVRSMALEDREWSPHPVAILGMTGLAVAATFFFGKYSK